MKYHITITNNETGEVIRDTDTNALVSVIDLDDQVGVSRGIKGDVDTVCNLAEMLLTEYYELIELLPKNLRRSARRQTVKEAKQNLKQKQR
jgi:hypothetical protein